MKLKVLNTMYFIIGISISYRKILQIYLEKMKSTLSGQLCISFLIDVLTYFVAILVPQLINFQFIIFLTSDLITKQILAEVFYIVNYVTVNYSVKKSTIDRKYLFFLQDIFFRLKPKQYKNANLADCLQKHLKTQKRK